MPRTEQRKITHKRFTVETTAENFKRIEQAAKEKRMNRSEFVRMCISKQLDK